MYAFNHQDKGFLPDGGTIPASETADHNKQVEQAEIARLKTAPDRVFLYVKRPSEQGPDYTPDRQTKITTFLGTVVSDKDSVSFSVRRYIGFDRWTYRRAITCRLFGVLYHGWYMESSGDYCRLKKAKHQ